MSWSHFLTHWCRYSRKQIDIVDLTLIILIIFNLLWCREILADPLLILMEKLLVLMLWNYQLQLGWISPYQWTQFPKSWSSSRKKGIFQFFLCIYSFCSKLWDRWNLIKWPVCAACMDVNAGVLRAYIKLCLNIIYFLIISNSLINLDQRI